MSSKRLIVLRGYPASGKSTIGRRLEEEGLGVFIDHNELLSFIARTTGDDEGIYEDIHRLELAMARKILADGKSAIVARGFTSQDQTDPYTNIAIRNQADAYIITLDVSIDTLEKRVVSPERKHGFNPSTSVVALKSWVEQNPRQPIKDENIIDANKPVGEVVGAIRDLVSNK